MPGQVECGKSDIRQAGWNAGCVGSSSQPNRGTFMKILLWIIAIIFIIGLLTVTGVLSLIF